MAFPWLKCMSVILVIVGTAILILGVVATPRVLPNFFDGRMDDYLIVDSPNAEQFDYWAGGSDQKNQYYLVINMYNLTNPAAVQLGATPNYQIVGPYMYRRYRQSVNVSFPEDGKFIQYSDYINYVFDANASGNGLSDTDTVTNINPVYIGALMQATLPGPNSAEANMLFGAVGGLFSGITGYFTGPFISLYTSYKLPAYFIPIMNSTIEELNATSADPTSAFIDMWRGAVAPVGNWTGLSLSYNGTQSDISFSTAQSLLDPTNPYSLMNGSPAAAWAWDQALTNATLASVLTSAFNLTASQLTLIWNWRVSTFGPVWMYPDFFNLYQLGQLSDLGWVQWGSGTPLGGQSVSALFPDFTSLGFFTQTELMSAAATWQEWKNIMNPVNGLQNLNMFQMFGGYVNMLNNNFSAGNFAPWQMNPTTAVVMFGYSAGLVGAQLIPNIYRYEGSSGGLFVTRSISEWTFNCDDYLLDLLKQTPPICSFKVNNTVFPPNVIYSGKSDISMIDMYVSWQNQTQVFGWQSPLNVSGHTQLGQFEPENYDHVPLSVWQDDLVRTVFLNYNGSSQVEGIDTDRYVLDFNSTFGPSEFYYQSTNGLANVSAFENGSPVMLSLWNMLYVPNATEWVQGLNQTNEFYDNTVIDVEPITGKTIQSRKRMQVNVNVPPNNDVWFTNFTSIVGNNGAFTSGIVYPLAQVGEYATISAGQAEMLLSKLTLQSRIKSISFYVGVTVGPALIVIGAALWFLAYRRRRGYSTLDH